MSKQSKNGQIKTRGTNHGTQTLHLALPVKALNHLKRLAKADKRSTNFKARELMESAIYSALGRKSRNEYESAGTNRQ